MLFIRSAAFSVGMVLSAIVFAIPAVLMFPLPFRARYGFISQWARFNIWMLAKTCNLRYEVKGRENIPHGAAVVLCKHQSAWETLALQEIFPPQVWVLKRELLLVPFFGWGLAMLEPIAINRGSKKKAMTQVLEQGTARLKNGRWVVIFPEGTRVAPGRRGNYRLGGARLAEHSGFPVVPVAHNAGEYWARRQFIKQPGTITISIGPPIPSEGCTAAQIHEAAVAWIEGEMAVITSPTYCHDSPKDNVLERTGT